VGDEGAHHGQQLYQRGEVQYFSTASDASGMPAAYHRPQAAGGLQTMSLPSLGGALGLGGAPLSIDGEPWGETGLL
jgi:hypothetical protein